MMDEKRRLRELPPGWMCTTIGEVAATASGGTPSRGRTDYYGGSIPWVKSGELKDRTVFQTEEFITELGLHSSSAKIFPAGTLCIALYGATVGKLGILGIDAATNQAVCGIFVPPLLITQYLFYFLFWQRQSLIELGKGGAQPNISQEIVRQTVIPIPPLPEQSRIVAKIEELFTELDAGIESLKKARAQLKRYRQAALQAAVTGELTREWREAHRDELEMAEDLLTRILRERRGKWEADQLAKMEAAGKLPKNDEWKKRYQEPAAPDIRERLHLPEGWTLTSLEAITSAVRVICYGILMPKENVSDGILYVKVKDMKGDRIDLKGLHRTKPEIAAQYARASLKTGDLLLAIRGTYGRVAEVPPELAGGNITQDTARLDISTEVDAKYIALHLRSEDSQNYYKRVARGVAVKGVNISEVRSTPILLPSFAEQQQIVSEVERALSIADATEQAIEQGLKQAERLRQSILHQAFAGKLVSQDPADEPAETLLARIRAERTQNGSVPRKIRRPMRNQKQSTQPDLLP